jgi:dihydropteroate synthase
MAIANVTPDSFYAGSRLDPAQLRERLLAIVAEQPDILDIGGQSTRPGSPRVSAEEELARVLPALATARQLAPDLPITVDTYSSVVARVALDAGADGINDISAGSLDSELLGVVAAHPTCGYVLMHMQGTPETMQREPHYDDVVAEVSQFFAERLAQLEALGIARERIVLDPGIGFGKRLEDNLTLIKRAATFATLGCPLLYGVSRKSFIGKLDPTAAHAADRLPGTLAATYALLQQGIVLHRVHDVAPTRQLCNVWAALH